LPGDLFLHTGASQVRYLPGGRLAMAWEPEATDAAARDRLADNPGNLSQRLARVAAELTHSGSATTYTVALSGFDTHADELARQERLFAELDEGLVSFYQKLRNLGIANRVTVFTATEFNRTLAPNARGGTEHGWGGHNLVLGGGVYGGDVVGRFPSMELGGPDDLGASGVWIPSISDQQYSYTMARWYGASDLSTAFPGLRNFSRPDADFLAFH
jgi:uncharacterized protein (DUF1501 family)